MVKTVTITSRKDLAELRVRLDDTEPVLTQIGALGVAISGRAFREQRLGEREWPGRYPGMASPFVNIAGLLSDLDKGGTIKGRRFKRTPALHDTGLLSQSVSAQVELPDAVSWGSTTAYAGKHQHGGESSQPVRERIVDPLAKFLKKKPEFRPRLGFLFHYAKTGQELVTNVAVRPFVGITDEGAAEMRDAIETRIAEAA